MLKIPVPKKYLCPLTHQIMLRPAIAMDGHTYEYDAMAAWSARHEVSPITRKKLGNKSLSPNTPLESEIAEFVRTNNPCLREELLRVCASDNVPAMSKLRFLDCHLETYDENGDTPLLAAIARVAKSRELASLEFKGTSRPLDSSPPPVSLMTVNFLLTEAKAALETQSKNGETPLCRAIRLGLQEVGTQLVVMGANLSTVTQPDQFTPLILAVMQGNEVMVRSLLENHAILHAVDKNGRSALAWACELGYTNIVQLLLAAASEGMQRKPISLTLSSSPPESKLDIQPARPGRQTLAQQNMLCIPVLPEHLFRR